MKNEDTFSNASPSEKVAALYNGGNNCEKAVMTVLQQVLKLPVERFNWDEFYSEKPEETDRFVCKAVIAGALGIYLKIIHEWEVQNGKESGWNMIYESRLAMELFNKMLQCTSGERTGQFETFNPFPHDPRFSTIPNELKKLYQNELSYFLDYFRKRFHMQDCVEILGFDPFNYEAYDTKTQEEIESGEWMKECLKCMQHVVTYFHRHNVELKA